MVNVSTLRAREEAGVVLQHSIGVEEGKIEALMVAESSLKSDKEKATCAIHSEVEKLIEAVKERGRQLLEQVESNSAIETREVKDRLNSATTRLASLRRTLSNLDQYSMVELVALRESGVSEAGEEYKVPSIKFEVGEEHGLEGWGRVLPELAASENGSDEDFEFIQEDDSASQLADELENCKIGVAPTQVDELSMWLRQRQENAVVPAEMLSSPQGSVSSRSRSSKRNLIDFPNLRMDPSVWLPRRKFKDARTLSTVYASMELSDKEIIPPSYALPYPFWLSK